MSLDTLANSATPSLREAFGNGEGFAYGQQSFESTVLLLQFLLLRRGLAARAAWPLLLMASGRIRLHSPVELVPAVVVCRRNL
jgi:hypothetical protein